jgi:hypothetical protein
MRKPMLPSLTSHLLTKNDRLVAEVERLYTVLERVRDRYVNHAAAGVVDGSTARDMLECVMAELTNE